MNIENDGVVKNSKTKRTGKEIKLKGEELGNSAVDFKIGASFDKHSPETIYIELSFWIDIKEREISDNKYSFINYDHEISRKLSNNIRNIYRKDLKVFLEKNEIFPYYLENIFIFDFPNNINYNNKRSFVSIELNLHTLNCKNHIKESYPLNNKKDTKIFDEAVKVCEIIANSNLLQGKEEFIIYRRKS